MRALTKWPGSSTHRPPADPEDALVHWAFGLYDEDEAKRRWRTLGMRSRLEGSFAAVGFTRRGLDQGSEYDAAQFDWLSSLVGEDGESEVTEDVGTGASVDGGVGEEEQESPPPPTSPPTETRSPSAEQRAKEARAARRMYRSQSQTELSSNLDLTSPPQTPQAGGPEGQGGGGSPLPSAEARHARGRMMRRRHSMPDLEALRAAAAAVAEGEAGADDRAAEGEAAEGTESPAADSLAPPPRQPRTKPGRRRSSQANLLAAAARLARRSTVEERRAERARREEEARLAAEAEAQAALERVREAAERERRAQLKVRRSPVAHRATPL